MYRTFGRMLGMAIVSVVLVVGLAGTAGAAADPEGQVDHFSGCTTYPDNDGGYTICGTTQVVTRTLTTPSGHQSWVVNGKWEISVTYANGYYYYATDSVHSQGMLKDGFQSEEFALYSGTFSSPDLGDCTYAQKYHYAATGHLVFDIPWSYACA